MRGKSELVKPQSADQTGSGAGAQLHYAMELRHRRNLLAARAEREGGASVPLAQNERAMSKANPVYSGLYSQLGQYWGEQPGTSGPVYVGAFCDVSFRIGLLRCKRGPMKWALLGGTVFSILLSWGKNFMGLTDFFIDYVPMYNKFRAVSSILVIAEFTIPLLAMLALKQIVEHPELLREKAKTFLRQSGAYGRLVAIVCHRAPRILPFVCIDDGNERVAERASRRTSGACPDEPGRNACQHLYRRRLAQLLCHSGGCGTAVDVCARETEIHRLILSLAALCLLDMWTVNKRYLYDAQFVAKGTEMKPFAQPSETDKAILKDTTYYRVLKPIDQYLQ